MTITYSGALWKALFRWKGSVYKAIWKQLLLFIVLYYIINLVYRFGLVIDDDESSNVTQWRQEKFEFVVIQCESICRQIPLTFLLGFYVYWIITRWSTQFNTIAWPDSLMLYITNFVKGHDSKSKAIRNTYNRYANLASVLAFRSLSVPILKRFPKDESLLLNGLINQQELDMLKSNTTHFEKFIVPLLWLTSLTVKCKEEKIIDAIEKFTIIGYINDYREKIRVAHFFDKISVPLVYTQVAVIAVYGYLAFLLIGSQSLIPKYPYSSELGRQLDFYIPIFGFMEVLFYLGWLQVGEDLISPWGEDDEDFEMNYVLDRNIFIGYLLANDLHGEIPPMSDENRISKTILHTRASIKSKNYVHPGNLVDYSKQLKPLEVEIISEEEAMKELEAQDEARKNFQHLASLMKKR